jgi:hypothetical protein
MLTGTHTPAEALKDFEMDADRIRDGLTDILDTLRETMDCHTLHFPHILDLARFSIVKDRVKYIKASGYGETVYEAIEQYNTSSLTPEIRALFDEVLKEYGP